MITTAFVNIWNQRVGAIAWNSDTGKSSFEYDTSFLKKNIELSPIKIPAQGSTKRIFAFPELRNIKTFKGLPGLLADTLPDKYGNALINAWLINQGRASDSLNPIEILCFIGKRGMGALEFEPAIPKANTTTTKIEIADIIDLLRNSLKFEIINSTNKFHSQIVIFPSVSVLFSHNSKNFYFSYNMFYCHSYF